MFTVYFTTPVAPTGAPTSWQELKTGPVNCHTAMWAFRVIALTWTRSDGSQ